MILHRRFGIFVASLLACTWASTGVWSATATFGEGGASCTHSTMGATAQFDPTTGTLIYNAAGDLTCPDASSGQVQPFRQTSTPSCPTGGASDVRAYPILQPGPVVGPRTAIVYDWYPGQALHHHVGGVPPDGPNYTAWWIPKPDDLSPAAWSQSNSLDFWGTNVMYVVGKVHGDPAWTPDKPCMAWVDWDTSRVFDGGVANQTIAGTPPPGATIPPSILGLATSVVRTWQVGTLEDSPSVNWYVFTPICIWPDTAGIPANRRVPTTPITYGYDIQGPIDPATQRFVWFRYTITIDPGSVTERWSDGAVTQGYAGPPGPDPVATCTAIDHVFKQVSNSASVTVTQSVTISGTVSWFDGVQQHSEPLTSTTVGPIVDSTFTHSVLQVDPALIAPA